MDNKDHARRMTRRQLLITAIVAGLLIVTGGAMLVWSGTEKNETAGTLAESSFSYPGRQGTDALTLLNENAREVQTERFSFGELVQSINGVGSASDKTHAWILYINGQAAQTGAADAITEDDDLIEWRYEEVWDE